MLRTHVSSGAGSIGHLVAGVDSVSSHPMKLKKRTNAHYSTLRKITCLSVEFSSVVQNKMEQTGIKI
jgi:hypothetical protein